MFESLTEKLQDTFRDLTGRGKLTERNIDDAMRQVRLALLDADVNYKIVKDFVTDVREECLGEKVLRSVTPGQQAIKVVNDHLATLMGEANAPLELTGQPAVILMVGLHGSGKTTTAAKLAMHLRKKLNRRPMLAAGDVYRPAAIDQLEVLGREIDLPVFSDRTTQDVPALAAAALAAAREQKCDTLIVDTAGRLQIDEGLIQELVNVKQAVKPDEILLVGDAALGQEAVSVATHFNDALGITGIVLTKLDGDARGGAALSMRRVTGRPIKFIGTGEKMTDLDEFHPDRMASRILGMGDVVSLVEKAAEQITEEEARRLEERMLKEQFDLDDFLTQLRNLQKLGGMGSVLSMIPGAGNLLKGADLDEGMLKHVEAIILSMTPYERSHPEVMGLKGRRQRVARGSGRDIVEVSQLLKRFGSMRQMMSRFGKMSRRMEAAGPSGGPPASYTAPGGVPTQESRKAKKNRRKRSRRGGKRK